MIPKSLTKILFTFFTIFLILPFSSINVNANASITYIFKNDQNQLQDNVNVLVYDCLDSKCSNVKIPNFVNGDNLGNSNDYLPNYDLTITFPTVLETQFGYALYYYKDGYIPVESFANWAGNGATTHNIVFSKKSSCSSHIENFRIINADKPNLPIQIFIKTKLDASTYSAFQSNPNSPEYVPMQFKDFYSAETKVTLKIFDQNNRAVFTGIRNLNLFMDSSEEVMFEWIPIKSGLYKAVMTTEVTDNQCSSTIPQSVTSEFTVVRTSLDKCYTLLNNLRTSVIEPFIGENVGIIANKISNYRDPDGDLFALATNVDLTVYDPNGNLIKTDSKLIPKNPDSSSPVEFTFNWVPQVNGLHTIKVHGIANDPVCINKENLDETETMNVLVKDQGPIDLNLRTIGNKQVNENSLLKFTINADYNGRRQLQFRALNLPEGASFNLFTREFSYQPSYDVVSHSLVNNILNFIGLDLSKDFLVTFKVTDGILSDQEIVRIRVFDVNRAPELEFISDISVNEGQLVKIIPVATDADGDPLKFFFTTPLNSRGEWQTKVSDRGTLFTTVTVKDNFNGQDSQQVKITVNPIDGEIPPTEVKGFVRQHILQTSSLFLENDEVKAGDYLTVYTKVRNYGAFNEKQVRIRLTIPELGIIEQRTLNYLAIDDQRLQIFIVNIPKNTMHGYYVAKVQVFNGNSQETESIEFRVV